MIGTVYWLLIVGLGEWAFFSDKQLNTSLKPVSYQNKHFCKKNRSLSSKFSFLPQLLYGTRYPTLKIGSKNLIFGSGFFLGIEKCLKMLCFTGTYQDTYFIFYYFLCNMKYLTSRSDFVWDMRSFSVRVPNKICGRQFISKDRHMLLLTNLLVLVRNRF